MLKLQEIVTPKNFNKKDLKVLKETLSHLPELQQEKTRTKLLEKQTNHIDFYRITPKEELPKSLQKMNFQTLNVKQSAPNSYVKIFNKQKQKLTDEEKIIRKAIREDNGQIMFLSEIYQYFDDDLDENVSRSEIKDNTLFTNVIGELDEWEKKAYKKKMNQNHLMGVNQSGERRISRIRLPMCLAEDQRRHSACMNNGSNGSQKKQFIVKKFKIGSDYRAEIEKNLELIRYSHANEMNLMNKYGLIESSSKLIKKELEEMKEMIQKEIEQKMKKLFDSRKEHHRLYEQKLRLQREEQQLEQQLTKQEGNILQMLSLTTMGYNFNPQQTNHPPKIKSLLAEKKTDFQKNQTKINKIKKGIQFLEEEILKNEEELKNILAAEKSYYQISLKNGIDFRESGLVWIIKKLGLNLNLEANPNNLGPEFITLMLLQHANDAGLEFPEYLDKKSRGYLLNKTRNEQQLQILINEKRDFVNQIGKENKPGFQKRSNSRKNSIKLIDKNLPIGICPSDYIKQSTSFLTQQDTEIPKKYIRSAQKISALRQEYIKNENLLKMSQSRGGIKFGYHLEGMTGKQIYNLAGEKIKNVDFSKLKKEKTLERHDKIFEYQAILKKIEQLHMFMEEQDIQHQNHLLSHYRDSKEMFFMQAAACFGVKRAYSLIIKNFSWKHSL